MTYIALILGLSGVQSLWNVAIFEESVGVCVYVVGGRTKVSPFFSWESLTVLQQLKGEWDASLRGRKKLTSLQGISNLSQISSNKNLGWFSLVTSQGHLPYSQLNHDYVTSVYSCSNFSPCFQSWLNIRGSLTFLHTWLPLFPWPWLQVRQAGFSTPFHPINHS